MREHNLIDLKILNDRILEIKKRVQAERNELLTLAKDIKMVTGNQSSVYSNIADAADSLTEVLEMLWEGSEDLQPEGQPEFDGDKPTIKIGGYNNLMVDVMDKRAGKTGLIIKG